MGQLAATVCRDRHTVSHHGAQPRTEVVVSEDAGSQVPELPPLPPLTDDDGVPRGGQILADEEAAVDTSPTPPPPPPPPGADG